MTSLPSVQWGVGRLLSPSDVDRIEALWAPAEWPDLIDAYTLANYRLPFSYYVERVRHLGLSGGVLLDVGCGGGRWSFAFATAFERVIGFDYTPRRLALAQWQKDRFKIHSVEFISGDVRRTPAADESVDVVYCNSVVFGVDSLEPILSEFIRVLKPGGICYLGLNAPGYAYELAARADPKLADYGRRRIYNTCCRQHLLSLVGPLGPGGAMNGEATALLQSGMSPRDLLAVLNARPNQVAAAQTITDDLGKEFNEVLRADLTAIAAGRKWGFGDREAGRDWDPDEMSIAAREAGFDRFEWAPDGALSLKADGSIEKGPSAKARPSSPIFQGRLRVFEMLFWKP